MAPVELAVIGAGSAQFSLGVVRDMAAIPSLWGSHVRFMDIDRHRLDVTHGVAERYTAEAGAKVTYSKTLDREEALDGAQFVLNCALVGGWRGRAYLREIAEKYSKDGSRPGAGVIRSFRQFDLFASIARDMHRICPDAVYIQSANPMTAGITLINRVAPISAVGLCHGINDIPRFSRILGLDAAKITAQAYGLNHFIWLTDYRCGAQDAYPVLDRWIESEAEAFWHSDACSPSHALGPKAVEMYRMLGLFPIGDTCTPGGAGRRTRARGSAGTSSTWRAASRSSRRPWPTSPLRSRRAWRPGRQTRRTSPSSMPWPTTTAASSR
jgi:alpha-galactosidase